MCGCLFRLIVRIVCVSLLVWFVDVWVFVWFIDRVVCVWDDWLDLLMCWCLFVWSLGLFVCVFYWFDAWMCGCLFNLLLGFCVWILNWIVDDWVLDLLIVRFVCVCGDWFNLLLFLDVWFIAISGCLCIIYVMIRWCVGCLFDWLVKLFVCVWIMVYVCGCVGVCLIHY